MNLSQIKAGSYKIFQRQSAEVRAANIVAIQYIESLANQMGANIALWDLEPLFKHGSTGNHYVKEKNEINKRFFEHLETIKKEAPVESARLRALIRGPIQQRYETTRQKAIQSKKVTLQNLQQDIGDHHARATDCVRRCWLLQTEIDQLSVAVSEANNPLEAELLGILESGWDFLDFSGDAVDFVTRSEVVVSEKNPAAGIDITVNLGKFRARLNLGSADVRVYVHQDNTMVSNFYHPHINHGGQPCWGNVSLNAAKCQAERSIKSLFEILLALLHSYSAEAPYRPLNDFYTAKARRDAPSLPEASASVEPPTTTREALTRQLVVLESNLNATNDQLDCLDGFEPDNEDEIADLVRERQQIAAQIEAIKISLVQESQGLVRVGGGSGALENNWLSYSDSALNATLRDIDSSRQDYQRNGVTIPTELVRTWQSVHEELSRRLSRRGGLHFPSEFEPQVYPQPSGTIARQSLNIGGISNWGTGTTFDATQVWENATANANEMIARAEQAVHGAINLEPGAFYVQSVQTQGEAETLPDAPETTELTTAELNDEVEDGYDEYNEEGDDDV